MHHESTSLTWRPLSRADAVTSADLLNAMEVVDRIGEHYTAEDTLQELIDPYLDLEQGTLGAFDGDAMVGFVKVAWKPGAYDLHRVVLDGGVRPDHRRRGVGTRLVRAGVDAAKALHARHHPTLDLAVDVRQAEHVTGAGELFRAQGFAATYYDQHMVHPLGDATSGPVELDGFRVEPWSEHNDDEFRTVRNESFRDHRGLVPMPVDNWKNRMIDHTFRPELSFLCRDGTDGAPAGMLLAKYWEADTAATGLRDAHFILIGTLRGYRRRGVAGTLVRHALRTAAVHDYDRVLVSVDSPASQAVSRIYVDAGFAPTLRHVHWSLELPRGSALTTSAS